MKSDDIIHQPVRLRVMAALCALPAEADGLDFSQLKKLTGATDGNLGAHLESLAKAELITLEKAFVARRPKTTARASDNGRKAFAAHVAYLRRLIADF